MFSRNLEIYEGINGELGPDKSEQALIRMRYVPSQFF